MTARPPGWIVSALCLPLVAATACQSTGPKESPATTAAPKKTGAESAGGNAEADPPKPAEPMGEIYGSPEMMDERAKKDIVDKPEPTDPPPAPIYGSPEVDIEPPEPEPTPQKRKP